MEELLNVANLVANKLNSRFDGPPEQRQILQALKVQEEAGELAQAVIGALGVNPNKGHSHTWDDVRAEACGTAFTALVLLHMLGGDPAWFLAEHLHTIRTKAEGWEATA
ncbi:MazG-like family protein [Kitasatospora sp. GP82]|uniref:MazG-like family protein n=1 Tax=Kitasatospora sp. GP82 TaxID=3035089 RepID=UPI002474813F|nr:MazG-like family protein [Kitasatospora sp. GP82]MDH6130213.1 NTP pyrophosphatase (non-canonical NTP hydrolase) [Kitasatospora sp. GP82]